MAATAPRLHNPAPRHTRCTCKTRERHGTKGDLAVKLTDTYHAFRGKPVAFIDMLRTGERPLPFDETVELMAGIRSREQGGVVVSIQEVLSEV
jgi:hypothetical protein